MKSKNTSKGLGDTVDKITTKTRIKKAVIHECRFVCFAER